MLLPWLPRRMRRKTQRAKPKRASRPAFRPAVETLEDRLAPAGVFTFYGGGMGEEFDWANKNHWRIGGVVADRYPGEGGVQDDDVILDFNADEDLHLSRSITVKSLDIRGGFGKVFEIQSGSGLMVKNAGANSKFNMEAGTLNLKDGSWLALDGLGTDATWTGGNLSENGHDNGEIYVHNGTTFTIKTEATRLGATLIIGLSPSPIGADQAATVNIAEENSGLAGNLTLYKNANIKVHPLGVLNLNQKVNSSTKGGIVNAEGSTGAIDNKGTINRKVVDPDAEQYLTLGPKVTNSGNGALFFMDADTKVNFAGDFDVNAGFFRKKAGADTKGNVKATLPGKIQVVDAGAAGQYHVYFRDNVILEGGTFEFVQETPGAYGIVHIGGNFTLADGATVQVHLDGSSDGIVDAFWVDGATDISDALLEITTQNASPSSEWAWVWLASGLGIIGEGLEIVNYGHPADYIFGEDLGELRVNDGGG